MKQGGAGSHRSCSGTAIQQLEARLACDLEDLCYPLVNWVRAEDWRVRVSAMPWSSVAWLASSRAGIRNVRIDRNPAGQERRGSPLGALAAKPRGQVQVGLKAIQRRTSKTFFFVTHDEEEMLTMPDRIGVKNKGRIEQDGTPEDLYFRPAHPRVQRHHSAAGAG
ncbi:hypothetical protein [Paracoccus benzoatiresistens]|uniref:Uncharacterized protein n=1 Tax=Paracoccus benzoatiresistens TaxID=2997341 RepID=A0ABT4J7E6_9RHOB|nr:hypothetical protein [Paracoccus sp. EF6]MCZ0962502.1 hypothetical protein [Paracoccus sp. EF6]